MKVTLYPTLAETLELHTRLIERFGGTKGVRDLGLLESALMRPQTGYYTSLSLEAAALLQSLAQNHAFVDGNKRVAFATTAIFLRMNGFRLRVDPDNGESFLIHRVIENKAEIEEIARWLEKHMQVI
ncbi:MAG: type II toxin-antitoxin system death-on-curing family toxin [Pseudobdellovibrionaceae bacterium]|nr:type II toxin-antitoxin system death-on-curing family toxin [Bdellovibrionales bacterium]USN46509.1 MAG: type II toxin-antitoxin system death-on-curing family toxin [Pseudobdellovibrionaceae bacterium]